MNPWGLTATEQKVIATVCETGTDKGAARVIGMSNRTLEIHMHAVRKKMGVSNRVLAAILWDRFTREQAGNDSNGRRAGA